MKKDLLILSAGLCGLYCAYLLHKKHNITIIEARDKIEGRIVTVNEHDLSPSCVWIYCTHITDLIKKVDLKLFEQYDNGFTVYEDKTNVTLCVNGEIQRIV